MNKLIRIDKYTSDDKEPTIPRNATHCYSVIFDDEDIEYETSYSKKGWDIDTEETSIMFYEGDELPTIENTEEANEAFVEQEHPREDDGTFADKGGGDYNAQRDNARAKLGLKPFTKWEPKNLQKWLDTKKEPDAVPPPEIRPQGVNYRIEARKSSLMTRIKVETEFLDSLVGKVGLEDTIKRMRLETQKIQTELDNIGTTEFEKSLPFMSMGKNTHTRSRDGYVTNKTKINIHPSIKGEQWTRMINERLRTCWNSLPDDTRDLVNTINVKISKTKHRSGKIRSGSWNPENNSMNFNLNTAGKIEDTFYHEIGHAKWYHKLKTEPHKIEKFIETQKRIGTSPTKYSESYRHHYEKNSDSMERKVRQIKKVRNLTPREEAIVKSNKERTEHLYQNECHSELNAYAMGEMPPEKIITSSSNMKKLLDAYKELWDL